MEIMFSMKLKPDGKTVRVEMLCAECRQEHNALAAAWQRYRDQGVVLIGIPFQDMKVLDYFFEGQWINTLGTNDAGSLVDLIGDRHATSDSPSRASAFFFGCTHSNVFLDGLVAHRVTARAIPG